MPALKYGILVSLCVSLQIISDSHSCIILPTSMHVFVGLILRVDVCMSPKYSKGGRKRLGEMMIICMVVSHVLLFAAFVYAPTKKAPRPTQTGHTNKHECTLTTTNSDKNEVNLDQADDETRTCTHVLSRTNNLVGWALIAPAPSSSATSTAAATSAGRSSSKSSSASPEAHF